MANDLAKIAKLLAETPDGQDSESIYFLTDYLRRMGIAMPNYEPESDIPEGLTSHDIAAMRGQAADGEPPFALAHDYGIKEAVVDDILEGRRARHAAGLTTRNGVAFGLDPRLYNRNKAFQALARGIASIAKSVLDYDLLEVFMCRHGTPSSEFNELSKEHAFEYPTAEYLTVYRQFLRASASKASHRIPNPGDRKRAVPRVFTNSIL